MLELPRGRALSALELRERVSGGEAVAFVSTPGLRNWSEVEFARVHAEHRRRFGPLHAAYAGTQTK